MIRTSRQLKDWIRNLSKEIGIEAHVLIRKYMMERFLERVSKSQYKESFILKGGMLISAFLGAEARATMDMDTTVKDIPVTIADMERTITEILDIEIDDYVSRSYREMHRKSSHTPNFLITFARSSKLAPCGRFGHSTTMKKL